ncbi:hypothetical protein O9A_00062 [Bartonella koehlerae C-29]|uniref:Uncharacterized protein n=1 Tax=Bartonella koehlerae C-29 TaxID=1134510 RepID=A0A067WIH2_9HYPH|nr:hypothetical protein O9A_00062 [Bartonella koehlerae C-29]
MIPERHTDKDKLGYGDKFVTERDKSVMVNLLRWRNPIMGQI